MQRIFQLAVLTFVLLGVRGAFAQTPTPTPTNTPTSTPTNTPTTTPGVPSGTPTPVTSSHFTSILLDNQSGPCDSPDSNKYPHTCKVCMANRAMYLICNDDGGVQHKVTSN